jgi:dipeptidyl aminopeptidase/acylaminoacyl peptidase
VGSRVEEEAVMNRTLRRTSFALASLTTLLGCSAPGAEPTAPVAPAPSPLSANYGAPLPASPLVGLPTGHAYSPTPTTVRLTDLKVVNLNVNGDPARIVHPKGGLAPGQRYPVVVFFHGSGMDQTQLTDRTRLAEKAADEGWLSASSLLTSRAHWADDDALRATGALIQLLVSQHQADPRRIYLVGFSMGGGTALLAAINPLGLPYRAAAVVSTQGFTDLQAMTNSEAGGGAYARPIAEAYGGDLTPQAAQTHSPIDQADRLRGIPVYLEHGEADTSVPPSHSARMAQKLTQLGMPPELHLYPGKGHSEETIDEDAIIQFLRGKVAPQ